MERRRVPPKQAKAYLEGRNETSIRAMEAGTLALILAVAGVGLYWRFARADDLFVVPILVGAAVAVLYFLRRRLRFHCPQCGRPLGWFDRTGWHEGDPICFVCRACRIEWDTGEAVHFPD